MPAVRPTTTASSSIAARRRARQLAAASALVVLAAGLTLDVTPASAQATLDFRSQVRPTAPKPGPNADPQMLVQAGEIQYDYTNERVVAAGNVQIYYKGASIEADRVVYDQKTKHLQAEGNVRLTEPDGKITYGTLLDLTDDYRDGFIDSLRIETPDQTRFAAARGQRSAGNYTIFESGVYTACEPCRDNPKKPPLWQVKAARIIHNQAEKMVYFEDAKIEFFGVPLAYMPYFSAPDPTVKRKSGFLMPLATTSTVYGYGLETPYYFALAPNYDLTVSPRVMTKQGLLMQGEWRHRLEDGYYSIRASGIVQADKDYFIRDNGTTTPGFRDFRGSVETTGRFNLSPRWTWGFDGILVSDATYFSDYKIRSLQSRIGSEFFSNLTEGVSQLFLTGRGERSYFDIRALHFYGFSEQDVQNTLPIVHPVMDYNTVLSQMVFGGELSARANLTSLSRQTAEYNAISQTAYNNNTCSTSADTAKTAKDCLLRGIPGTYSRFSSEIDWRSRYVDTFGNVFIPFASVRADAAQMHINSDPSVSNFIQTGDSSDLRVMPTVGLEYRLPLISVHSWGTQTLEPIAQVIARPNETRIGKLPNEDAQSLVFDDSNLFRVDKFSGWDRVEGGGRANYGLQYTAQVNQAGAVNVLFGQSYSLFGTNSFAVGDTANTGLDSGLDKRASDYVARFAYTPNRIFSLISRYRFDQADFTLQRLEIEGTMSVDRWNVSLMYGNYAAQPELGFLERREGVLGSGSYKIDANWLINGAARYDIEHNKLSQTRVGLGYMDDCFLIGLNYITDYQYSGNVTSNHTVMLQVGLRTIGSTSSSSSASTIGTQ